MRRRLRQVGAALSRRGETPQPVELVGTPRTARLFGSLAPHDQRHLIAVHHRCVDAGLSADVAFAGLLHDIGKASLSGRHVTVVDRSLRVILRRLSPALLRRLSREAAPGIAVGLVLAEHHAALGAGRIAALGWPDPVVDAVRRHESGKVTGELAALRRIDDDTI